MITTYRWKPLTRRLLGWDLADTRGTGLFGTHFAECDHDGLEVAYPPERTTVQIHRGNDSVLVHRVLARANPSLQANSTHFYVSALSLSTEAGAWKWTSNGENYLEANWGQFPPFPIITRSGPGVLTTPAGRCYATEWGTGLLHIPDLLHAYESWTDSDRAQGWTVICEVQDDVEPDRDLIAAIPLLLCGGPPRGTAC